MRKYRILLITILLTGIFSSVKSQSKYLSDIIKTDIDKQYSDGYTGIAFSYWRHDTCIYSNQICKYNTSTAGSIKVEKKNGFVIYEFLRRNVNGYPGHNEYDTFKYFISEKNDGPSFLIRKLLIRYDYKTDSFKLMPVDTLYFNRRSIIKRVFGDSNASDLSSLKVFVFKSVDKYGSIALHFWVERVGIVKITEEKCWRYSFEIDDGRSKIISRFFAEIMRIIKTKYKDPYWLSQSCEIEK